MLRVITIISTGILLIVWNIYDSFSAYEQNNINSCVVHAFGAGMYFGILLVFLMKIFIF